MRCLLPHVPRADPVPVHFEEKTAVPDDRVGVLPYGHVCGIDA